MPSFKNGTFVHNSVLENNETKSVSIHWQQHVPGCHGVGAQDSVTSAFLGSVTGLFTPEVSKECSAVIFKVLRSHRWISDSSILEQNVGNP
jgi:hypothetical protein